MTSYTKMAKVHTRLIHAQRDMLTAYDYVSTDEFQLAIREYHKSLAEIYAVHSQDTSRWAHVIWKKFLNAQRALIRAQVDLLHRNNVYGEILWQLSRS